MTTRLLIVLAMPEPVIARYRDRLSAEFPELEIVAVNHRDKIDPYIASTRILVTFGAMMGDEVYRKAPRLEWVQALGTGVDRITDAPSLGTNVLVTNVPGIHGAPVAEAAIAAMLALSRQLPRAVRAQARHEWERWPSRLLGGKTVAIFGIGVIAEALAPQCNAFGMRVVGISSAPRPVPGFDHIHPRADLVSAVGDCDYLVLLTPFTPATHGIVGEAVFAALKPTCHLVNFGRGEVVDEAAMIRALNENRLAGAALDVFETEPPPPDHPLWAMQNVIMTAHLGGFYEEYPDRALPVVEENLRRFLTGDRLNMINVVSRGEGR